MNSVLCKHWVNSEDEENETWNKMKYVFACGKNTHMFVLYV
jgi:hypothetical protein